MNSSSSGSSGNFRGGSGNNNYKNRNSSSNSNSRPYNSGSGGSGQSSQQGQSNQSQAGGQGGSSSGYSGQRPQGSYNRYQGGQQGGYNSRPRPYSPGGTSTPGSSSTAPTTSAQGTTGTPAAGGNFNRRPFNPNFNNRSGGGPRPYGGSSGGYQRRDFRREGPPEAHRINGRISAREVRVITESGEQLGVMPTTQALELAQRDGFDLVEVAAQANPPVCKIMDYGKFKYKEQKKEAEAKKKRTETTLKELRIRYRTDSGDLETKLKQARDFFAEGDKVKFSMRFKGREAAFINLGVQKFDQIVERLADVASVDERSPAFGKQIHITFAPLKAATPVKAKKETSGDATKGPKNADNTSNTEGPNAGTMGKLLAEAIDSKKEGSES